MITKHLCTIFAALLLTSATQAQSLNPKLQLEAGASMTNMRIVLESNKESVPAQGDPVFDLIYGASVDIPMNKSNSVEVGVYNLRSGATLYKRGFYEEYVKTNYVHIPLDYKLKISAGKKKSNVFLTVGPYVGYMIKGYLTQNGVPIAVHKGYYKYFHRFDIGVGAGAGYMFAGGFFVKGNVALGLYNINYRYDETAPLREKLYNRPMASLMVGFQF